METLRIHVERIVRPIRASERRKNKMREELLAHLEQRTREAMARGASEQEACAFAATQLGDPAALRQELQATAPAIERALFVKVPVAILDSWFEKGAQERALRFAWVRTIYTTILVTPVFVIANAIVAPRWIAMIAGQRQWDSVWVSKHGILPLLLLAGNAAATLVIYFAADATGLRKNLSNRCTASAVARAVSMNIFIGGYLALFLAIALAILYLFKPVSPTNASVVPVLWFVVPVFIALVLLSFLLLAPIFAFAARKERQQYEKWGRLKLDE